MRFVVQTYWAVHEDNYEDHFKGETLGPFDTLHEATIAGESFEAAGDYIRNYSHYDILEVPGGNAF